MSRDENNKLDTDDFLHYAMQKARRNSMYEVTLKLYTALGIIAFIISCGYFISTLIEFSLTEQQALALVMGGSGVMLSVFSWLLLSYRRQKAIYESERMKEIYSISELVRLWGEFESESRKVLSIEGDDYNKYSVRSVISKLRNEEKINDTDVQSLQEALEARNTIVHGGKMFSPDLIDKYTNHLKAVITKISNYLIPI